MKKIELKKFGVGSVFKVIMYMMIIPIALFFIIGIVIALVGVATQAYEFVGIGILIAIGYPVFFIIIYGLFGSLMTLIYNGLASKFGGLEITINELGGDTELQVNVEEIQ